MGGSVSAPLIFRADLSDALQQRAGCAVHLWEGFAARNSKYYFSKLISRAAIAVSHVK